MDLKQAERVMGLSIDASTGEILAVRRRLARLHHPDRHSPGPARDAANRRMAEINAAFEKLRSERRLRRVRGAAAAAVVRPPQPDTNRRPGLGVPIRVAVGLWLAGMVLLFVGALLVWATPVHPVISLGASTILGCGVAVLYWSRSGII